MSENMNDQENQEFQNFANAMMNAVTGVWWRPESNKPSYFMPVFEDGEVISPTEYNVHRVLARNERGSVIFGQDGRAIKNMVICQGENCEFCAEGSRATVRGALRVCELHPQFRQNTTTVTGYSIGKVLILDEGPKFWQAFIPLMQENGIRRVWMYTRTGEGLRMRKTVGVANRQIGYKDVIEGIGNAEWPSLMSAIFDRNGANDDE